MSQMHPEPEPVDPSPEPVGVPSEATAIPPAPPDIPVTPMDESLPGPSMAVPSAPLPPPPPDVPVTLPVFSPAVSAMPKGPDWQRVSQVSQAWMQKSQEITVKLLYDAGGWVFGGLIVAALMLLQALIALGFADRATLVSGLAIAIALPFNLAGLGMIRYFNVLNQAVEQARLALGQNPNLDAGTLMRLTQESNSFSPGKRLVMDSSLSLALYLSVFFTIIGSGAALWRISWVVTLLFLLASVAGFFLVLRVIRSS